MYIEVVLHCSLKSSLIQSSILKIRKMLQHWRIVPPLGAPTMNTIGQSEWRGTMYNREYDWVWRAFPVFKISEGISKCCLCYVGVSPFLINNTTQWLQRYSGIIIVASTLTFQKIITARNASYGNDFLNSGGHISLTRLWIEFNLFLFSLSHDLGKLVAVSTIHCCSQIDGFFCGGSLLSVHVHDGDIWYDMCF